MNDNTLLASIETTVRLRHVLESEKILTIGEARIFLETTTPYGSYNPQRKPRRIPGFGRKSYDELIRIVNEC